MEVIQHINEKFGPRSLKVGVVDLIERQPSDTLYGRVLNPNFASIMPQVVGVWAEQLGHQVEYVTYTGYEDLRAELPRDVNVLFINSFTQAAYLAYSISNLYRKKNVVTVLGGPHARAYAEDAKDYFDYVLGLTDKRLVSDLLSDPSPNPSGGVYLSAAQQPETLPGVRERWKFVRKTLAKTKILHLVQVIGSLGCPYKCNFCIDSEVDYQTLPYDQLREDLSFLAKQPSPPTVAWVDPNFGVRFDEYMDVIESAIEPGGLDFAAESSLSLLSEPHLKRMKQNGFALILPGIESWFDYNNKSKQGKHSGMDKVRSVAEHVNMIQRYIPYVGTNFIFGQDSDAGEEPFELTKRFLDLAPGVFPKYSLLTAFGNAAPLNRQYQAEGRVIDVPFQFLDGYSALNVVMKNYTHVELFDNLISLMEYTLSPKLIWRRFQANKTPLGMWMNLMRALSSDKSAGNGAGMLEHYRETRRRLSTDADFQDFFERRTAAPPAFYRNEIRSSLGPFYEHLPAKVVNYLRWGEPGPNSRILSPKSEAAPFVSIAAA
jgi:hypothetical protein